MREGKGNRNSVSQAHAVSVARFAEVRGVGAGAGCPLVKADQRPGGDCAWWMISSGMIETLMGK